MSTPQSVNHSRGRLLRPLPLLLAILCAVLLGPLGLGLQNNNPCSGTVEGTGAGAILQCTAAASCLDPVCSKNIVLPPPGGAATFQICTCNNGPAPNCCETVLVFQDGSPPTPNFVGNCELETSCGPGECGMRAFRVNERVFFRARCFLAL